MSSRKSVGSKSRASSPFFVQVKQTKDSIQASRKKPFTQKIAPRMMPRAKKTTSGETLFNVDDYLRDRWFIRGLIGQGGYGEIYHALDTKEALDVAIKTEDRIRRGRTSKRMILEQRVLLCLQGKLHVPRILASGHDEKINFIVMELLSVNVGELKKQSPYKRLGRSTVGRIVMQCIAALRDVHHEGYLHRDVKPANMCFGITSSTRHILMLVDFGLVRRYRNANGTVRRPRKKAGFRVHERMEQTPLDDFVALAYSGIELLLGDLPWKMVTNYEDVKSAKEELLKHIGQENSFLSLAPKPFQHFCCEVLAMEHPEALDYTQLQSLLTDVIGDRGLSDPYDWENSYRETDPSTLSTEAST